MKNKFTAAGCECVHVDGDYRVYKIETLEQAISTTNTTCWCASNPKKFDTSHTPHKYVVVKILKNGLSKIIAGVDLGFGLIRMPNNDVITQDRLKPISNIIDHLFTDEVIDSITPKGTDGYMIPDIWIHRNISPRIFQKLIKNCSVVQSIYLSKYNK